MNQSSVYRGLLVYTIVRPSMRFVCSLQQTERARTKIETGGIAIQKRIDFVDSKDERMWLSERIRTVGEYLEVVQVPFNGLRSCRRRFVGHEVQRGLPVPSGRVQARF